MTKQEILENKHVLKVERAGGVIRVTLKKGWYLVTNNPRQNHIMRHSVLLLPEGNNHKEYYLRFVSKKEADTMEEQVSVDQSPMSGRSRPPHPPRR